MSLLTQMKKLSSFSLAVVLSSTMLSYGAVVDKDVLGVELLTFPNRVVYDVGEDVDLYGMTVKVKFVDGEEAVVDYKDLMCVGYDPNRVGSQLISAMYGSVSVPFSVTVKEGTIKAINAALNPRKVWIGGTKLLPNDFTVKAILDTGKEEEITDFDYTPKYLNSGRNVITVIHGNLKSLVSVEAKENVCQSIRIETHGTQEFDVGELFNQTGLKVIAHYLDGSEDDVTTACKVTGVNTGKAGKYYAEVAYQEKKATYEVTVSSYTFSRIDISRYYETGTVDLYFNERQEPVTIDTDNIKYEDDYETNTRTFYVIYKNNTYTVDAGIPEDEQKVVSSNRIQVTVPIGLKLSVNSDGLTGYVEPAKLVCDGEYLLKVHTSMQNPVEFVNGLPAIISYPKVGSTVFPLDISEIKLNPATDSMYYLFNSILEVADE